MPLLLRGLNLPDNEIRAGVIDTLIATTDPNSNHNELVSKYASSLVTVMLKNSKVKGMPSPVCKVWQPMKRLTRSTTLGRPSRRLTIHCYLTDRGSVRCSPPPEGDGDS